MNLKIKLLALSAQVTDLESELQATQCEIRRLLEPLFKEQACLARRIIEEPQYGSLRVYWRNCLWLLASKEDTEDCQYSRHGDGNWYQECLCLRDDDYRCIQLLPCFLSDYYDGKEAAVRAFFQALADKDKEMEAQAQQFRLENARKVLADAGLIPNQS